MAYSLHPLLEDGIPPGLADDQVSPLHHHDADKEGRLARELQHLPLLIGLGKDGQRGAISVRRDSAMPQRLLLSSAFSHPKAELGDLFRFPQPFSHISVIALFTLCCVFMFSLSD